MPCNYRNSKRLKTFKMEVLQKKKLINVPYFNAQNPNPMSIFVGRDRKISIILKNIFFRIVENITSGGRVPLRQAAFGVSLSTFGASLRPTLLAIGSIAPPKASLRSGKIYQLHIFCAEGNNTLELISY